MSMMIICPCSLSTTMINILWTSITIIGVLAMKLMSLEDSAIANKPMTSWNPKRAQCPTGLPKKRCIPPGLPYQILWPTGHPKLA